MNKKTYITGIVGLGALLACAEPGAKPSQAQGRPPPALQVITVQPEAFTETLELPGRVVARRTAEIRARVTGIVQARKFEEGSEVKEGQPLFQIDPAPYQAAVAQAKAAVAQARASLADAEAVVTRNRPLSEAGAVSPQQFQAQEAQLKVAQAAVVAAQAGLRTARLNLSYASVRSPISGRIGKAKVTEGALVSQATATLLATVQQLDPVYVDFSQNASDFLRARAQLSKPGAPLAVSLPELPEPLPGKLSFADRAVDAQTGQVSLRGEFGNPDGVLLPGLFVRVKVRLAELPQAILVPQSAVLRASDGSASVMLVSAAGEVTPRPVTTGVMSEGRWLITSGLKGGERLIAQGADKVRPGMKLPPAGAKGQQPAGKPAKGQKPAGKPAQDGTKGQK